jgi:hypothetical protein
LANGWAVSVTVTGVVSSFASRAPYEGNVLVGREACPMFSSMAIAIARVTGCPVPRLCAPELTLQLYAWRVGVFRSVSESSGQIRSIIIATSKLAARLDSEDKQPNKRISATHRCA